MVLPLLGLIILVVIGIRSWYLIQDENVEVLLPACLSAMDKNDFSIVDRARSVLFPKIFTQVGSRSIPAPSAFRVADTVTIDRSLLQSNDESTLEIHPARVVLVSRDTVQARGFKGSTKFSFYADTSALCYGNSHITLTIVAVSPALAHHQKYVFAGQVRDIYLLEEAYTVSIE